MRVYERIALKDWYVSDDDGNRQDVTRGKKYTTSRDLDDGTCILYSGFWVRVPLDVFEPLKTARPIC